MSEIKGDQNALDKWALDLLANLFRTPDWQDIELSYIEYVINCTGRVTQEEDDDFEDDV
jgi:hypothetical protein